MQDLAQEAFCRAWQRWPALSTYDNPGAWVRRVAVNLAYSRWRRLKTATAYLLRQRVATVTAAVLAIVGVVMTVVLSGRPSSRPLPVGNSPTPSASPNRTVGPGTIEETDWYTAKIDFDAPGGCTTGTVGFKKVVNEYFVWAEGRTDKGYLLETHPYVVAYGNLNGDDRLEAVLEIACGGTGSDGENYPRAVAVIEQRDDQSLHTLGWAVAPRQAAHTGRWVQDGTLFTEAHDKAATVLPGSVESYRWTGSAFAKTDASSAYPRLTPSRDGARLDLSRVVTKIQCGTTLAKQTVIPDFDAAGRYEMDGRVWNIAQSGATSPFYVVLNPADFPYLLIEVGCGDRGSEYVSNLVMFAQTDTGWRALAVIGTAARDIDRWYLEGKEVMVLTSQGWTRYAWNATEMEFVQK